jgi:cytidylate kinase
LPTRPTSLFSQEFDSLGGDDTNNENYSYRLAAIGYQLFSEEVTIMAVLTISRELGSEGTVLAKKVAQELGYHFADKALIEKVLDQYGLVEFEEAYESGLGFWSRFDTPKSTMVKFLNQVIQTLAWHGNVVIMGRGSFAVLHGLADVLNVRIKAPRPLRISRVMAQQGITAWDKAEALVKESDKVRAVFVESWYGVNWDTVSDFDLVIDTGKVSPDLAVTWLTQALRNLAQQEGGDQPSTRKIEVDPVLASAISEVLECKAKH